MKTIWKYKLDSHVAKVSMPKDAVILTAREQLGEICIWAEVDDQVAKETRYFDVFGTGYPMHEDIGVERKYIGTAFLDNGLLVFHVYEKL